MQLKKLNQKSRKNKNFKKFFVIKKKIKRTIRKNIFHIFFDKNYKRRIRLNKAKRKLKKKIFMKRTRKIKLLKKKFKKKRIEKQKRISKNNVKAKLNKKKKKKKFKFKFKRVITNRKLN